MKIHRKYITAAVLSALVSSSVMSAPHVEAMASLSNGRLMVSDGSTFSNSGLMMNVKSMHVIDGGTAKLNDFDTQRVPYTDTDAYILVSGGGATLTSRGGSANALENKNPLILADRGTVSIGFNGDGSLSREIVELQGDVLVSSEGFGGDVGSAPSVVNIGIGRNPMNGQNKFSGMAVNQLEGRGGEININIGEGYWDHNYAGNYENRRINMNTAVSSVNRLVGTPNETNLVSIYQNAANDIHVNTLSGHVNVLYNMTGINTNVPASHKDGTDPSHFEGGNFRVKSAEAGAAVHAYTTPNNINTSSESAVNKVLDSLASKIYYENYVTGERNLSGTVAISSDGLGSSFVRPLTSGNAKTGDITWKSENGQGSYVDPNSVVPEPEQPTTPTTQDEPTTPTVPEQPIIPETPNQPEPTPEPTPVDPTPTPEQTPVDPTPEPTPVPQPEPEQPITPTTSVEPTNPTTSDEPTTPTVPEQPITPTVPEQPVTPTTPEQPTPPTTSEQPITPVQPEPTPVKEEPVPPTNPTEPTTPVAPVEPEQPTNPSEPTSPVAPVEPVNPGTDTGNTSNHSNNGGYVRGDYDTPHMRGVRSAVMSNIGAWRTMTDDMYRTGELQRGAVAGIWAHVGAGRYEFSGTGVSNESDYTRFQGGFDKKFGTLIVGGQVEYLRGDDDFNVSSASRSGSGKARAFTGGMYAKKDIGNDAYVHVETKVGRVSNDFTVYNEIGSGMSGKVSSTGYSLAARVGKQVKFDNGFYVEPQAQLSYMHLGGDTFNAGPMTVHQSGVSSTAGKLGLEMGKTFGTGSMYTRFSVGRAFTGNVKTTYTQGSDMKVMDTDIKGTWTELAFGGRYGIGSDNSIFADVSTGLSGDYKQTWGVNAGVSHKF